MKPFLPLAMALAVAAMATATEPKMTADQVSAVGKLLIEAKQHEEYLGMFLSENPTFDSKSGVWHLARTIKADSIFPEGPMHFCQIRDSDAHFRIGAISGSGFLPKSCESFRMKPSFRQKIARILGK